MQKKSPQFFPREPPRPLRKGSADFAIRTGHVIERFFPSLTTSSSPYKTSTFKAGNQTPELCGVAPPFEALLRAAFVLRRRHPCNHILPASKRFFQPHARGPLRAPHSVACPHFSSCDVDQHKGFDPRVIDRISNPRRISPLHVSQPSSFAQTSGVDATSARCGVASWRTPPGSRLLPMHGDRLFV